MQPLFDALEEGGRILGVREVACVWNDLADHKTFTLATDTHVYFCDPRSPWQRGTNENTNRLLRQSFPKGTDLSAHSQTALNRVAHQLNQRPRKTLGYATPADRLQASVALTG
jgi:IS30 family transposase